MVKLVELAYARSGDKGDLSNIGVARRRSRRAPRRRAPAAIPPSAVTRPAAKNRS